MLKSSGSRGENFLTQSFSSSAQPSLKLRKNTPDTIKNIQTKDIEKELDFILSHFDLTIFPRTISTFQSQNKQIMVREKVEILKKYDESSFVDCRINAFPSLKEGARWTSDFIFIDLDLTDFKSKRSLGLALKKTLRNIKERLEEAHPTVLWTGGGYHIYQPIRGIELDHYRDFNEFSNLNLFNEFLRFTERFLSFDKANKNNNPSLKSCLLRIPGSINSKYSTEVSIVQKWNGYRPSIKLLIGDFYAYLGDNKVTKKGQKHYNQSNNKFQTSTNNIPWIGKLLETPIEDGRKYALWRILCPYLENIKKMSPEESFLILDNWLDQCDMMKALGYNKHTLIKNKLRYVNNYKPISHERLKKENNELYNKIVV